MKRIIALLMSVLLMISSSVVFADSWQQEITVTYNGKLIDFETQPQIINDRTMVPFRAIFETLGGEVDFDSETRTVSSEKDGEKLSFVIGEYEAVLENAEGKQVIEIDSAPVIVNDYTLVPVRFVAEGSGLKVNWDDFYREVVIIDTDAWRKTIEEKSPFLSMFLDMPVSSLDFKKAFSGTEEADVKLNFKIENAAELYGEGESGPENIDLDISLKIKGEESFDGETVSAKSAVTLDLSSVGELIKKFDSTLTDADLEMISKTLKLHNINIEVIADKDKNVYLKSNEILDLIKEFGGEKFADMIGDNYVKIPYPTELLGLSEDLTLWSYVETMVESDETLTTEDVVMIELVLGAIADLYSEECVSLEEKDGGFKVTFDITKEDYMKAVESMINAIWEYEGVDTLGEAEKQFAEAQKQEMMKIYDMIDVEIKGYIDAKDEVNQSSEVSSFVKMTNMLIPYTENALLSFSLEVSAKSAFKESAKVKKTEVPKNVIDVTEWAE